MPQSAQANQAPIIHTVRQPLEVPPWPHAIWSIDFASDCLYSGRRFRTLNVLDEGVREALAIQINISLPSEQVVCVPEQLTAWRGVPHAIRLDNGPELFAQQFLDWCPVHAIEMRYIRTPASLTKTLTSSASIGLIAKRSLAPTCLR